jgi:SecD/SecF fusion protein
VSDKSKNLLILLTVVAALVAVGVVAVVKSPVLGLDLRGGLEVTLQAKIKPGQTPPSDFLQKAEDIMRSRVDKLGVSEPEIRKEPNSNRITISLAGVKDPQRALQIIGSTAQLYLVPFERSLVPSVSSSAATGQPVLRHTLYDLLLAAKNVPSGTGIDSSDQWYAFDPKTKATLTPVEDTKQQAKQAVSRLRTKPKDVVYLKAPAGTLIASCDAAKSCIPTPSAPGTYWYLFKQNDPNLVLKGSDLTSVKQDFDPQTGGPIVTFNFTGKGRNQFHSITSELATDGKTKYQVSGAGANPQNYFQHFAVVLDNHMETAPYIDFQQNPDGINGDNGAEIGNIGSVGEAQDIALVLQTGSLPVQFVPIESTQVSATLGKDSLRQGLIAGLAGLVLVMIYLLVFYRFLGLIADLALLIYAALFYGLIVLIPITMTLPGIAGMILTIGVAADANVVIFERIKEEVRLGRSVRQAISRGYQRGFHTIIDANVVTLITAFVLFEAGTGSVKGFAFTLAVGVIVSVFTAVFATRAMLGFLAGFRWFNNASFMGASGQKVRWHFDVVGRKYVWFAISGVILLAGAASIATQGLNLGIDFKGGTRIDAVMSKPASITQVRDAITKVDPKLASAEIQGTGKPKGNDYTSFQIQTKTLTPQQSAQVKNALVPLGYDATKGGEQSVSASFGSSIVVGAIYAIVFSLLLIIGYVSIRFEWKYAAPIIIALLHDVLLTIGLYSLTNRQVTSATVAAVLTVLGYSMYDTIIVFDRVRENAPLLRKHTFPQIVNVSVWETLTRSINTSLITLVPIASLLLFGGSTLKDFAFALLIGIASGAYSSIFIAAPLLAMWKGTEEEYRHRRGVEGPMKETLAAPAAAAPAQAPAEDAEPEPALVGAQAPPATPPGDDAPSDDEQAARDAARRRRQERRARGRQHGRR